MRSPGFLHIYKDKKAASDALARSKDPSSSPDSSAVVIDLKNVLDFSIPTRKNKDDVCVDLELGHESMRLKYVFSPFLRLFHILYCVRCVLWHW